MAYIESAPGPGEGCIFCDKPAAGDDELAYILARAERAFVLLNTFPYNPGHLMVAPFRHVADLEGLGDEEMSDISALLRRSVQALKDAVGPEAFNVGMNLGRVAGAGIPGHLHWHVVPRWSGDTNFMTVLGDVRVLPEGLAETYRKLKPGFSSGRGKRSAQPGPEAGNIQ
jgi:ATP adenylyltransferase